MPKIPALTDQIAYAAVNLADADHPPSHDQLSRLFAEAALTAGDPGAGTGKKKRMRAVIDHALRHDRTAGAKLVNRTIAVVRGEGGFRDDSAAFIGTDTLSNLQDAYRASGWELADDGEVGPLVLDNVPLSERDAVLRGYVRRIRRGARDAPLVTGSGKDLLEASAQTVLESKGRSYQGHDFPGILYHAFDAVDLPRPDLGATEAFRRTLSSDAGKRVQQVLYLLGCEVNKLRNTQGTGHGRAFAATVSDQEASTAAQAMAMISELLLAEAED
jgi:hypothetical protein